MCEINPAHTLIMRLEAFTSDRSMSAATFQEEVGERVVAAEQALNADGRFRFHVHSGAPQLPMAQGECAGCHDRTFVRPMLVKSASLRVSKPEYEKHFHAWRLFCETCEDHVIAGHSDVVLVEGIQI